MAVIVSWNVPAGVLPEVATVKVELPDRVIDCGLNEPLAPAGNPLTLNVAVPRNQSRGEIVTV